MRLPLIALLAASCAACGWRSGSARLATGAAAPGFTLPGTDGRAHSLDEFRESRALVVVFTSNTCPAAQLDESRIRALADDYRAKGVAVVAINPGPPSTVEAADLRYSDVGDSLDDMKVRATYRRLGYPYLSDAATRSATSAYRVTTVPHVFVFDRDRKLQYDGRIADSPQRGAAAPGGARQAIDALLAGRPVPASRTEPAGCDVSGPRGAAIRQADARGPAGAGPPSAAARANDPGSGAISVDLADADALKKLRRNDTGRLLLVNFWATWCAPCAAEFPDLEATYRMYEGRGLAFTTVSVNDPGEREAVLAFLKVHGAAHRNLLFGSSDVYGLQAAFDPAMPAPVPFTVLIDRRGDVRYQELGELDILKLRRAILAALPDDPEYPGLQAYWSTTND